MRNYLFFMALWLGNSYSIAATYSVLHCPLRDCSDCELLIDTKDERVEYMNNESSYFMSKKSKDSNKRIFELSPDKNVPSPGYRLIFTRKSKTASLIEINYKDESEKYLYKNLKCMYSNQKLSKGL